MTREEAIEFGKSIQSGYDSQLQQFISTALSALEELPKSRKEARRWKRKMLAMNSKADAITRHSYSYGKMDAIKEIIQEVENMDTLITRSEVLEVIDKIVEGSK